MSKKTFNVANAQMNLIMGFSEQLQDDLDNGVRVSRKDLASALKALNYMQNESGDAVFEVEVDQIEDGQNPEKVFTRDQLVSFGSSLLNNRAKRSTLMAFASTVEHEDVLDWLEKEKIDVVWFS